MPQKSQGHVFISYAIDDKEFVHSVIRELQERNVDVWLGQSELLPGENWQFQLEQAIRNANVMLIVVSENSANSHWQNVEIGMALSITQQTLPNRQTVIPVRLKYDDRFPSLPSFLDKWKYIDSDALNIAEVAELVAKATNE